MNIPTIEELAKTAADTINRESPMLASFEDLKPAHQDAVVAGMQAAIDRYIAAIGEGMPSVEELVDAYMARAHFEGHRDFVVSNPAMTAVRNLMLAAFGAHMEKQGEQHQLERGTMLREIETLKARLEKAKALVVRHHDASYHCEVGMFCPVCSPDGKDGPWNEAFSLSAPVAVEEQKDSHAHLKAAWEAGKRIRVKTPEGRWMPWVKKGGDVLFWTESPERYEIEPEQPATIIHNGVEYIKHTPGDPCPVDERTLVEVLLHEGEVGDQRNADDFAWGNYPSEPWDNIIGYRVIQPAPLPAEESHSDKWANEKSAYANGLQIEYRNLQLRPNDPWDVQNPCFFLDIPGAEYRIAPGQEIQEHHQPPAGLVLHNPHNLTPEQVGPDHRLGCTTEQNIGRVDQWRDGEWVTIQMHGTMTFGECIQTYRVPISTPWPEVVKGGDQNAAISAQDVEPQDDVVVALKATIERQKEELDQASLYAHNCDVEIGRLKDWKARAEAAEKRVKELEAELSTAREAWSRQHDANIKHLMKEEARMKQRVKELEAERDDLQKRFDRIATACARWEWRHCTTEKELIESVDDLMKERDALESRLALLTPRPVSVKPSWRMPRLLPTHASSPSAERG